MYKYKRKNKIRLNTTNLCLYYCYFPLRRLMEGVDLLFWHIVTCPRLADGNDSKIVSFKFITLLPVTVIQSLQ